MTSPTTVERRTAFVVTETIVHTFVFTDDELTEADYATDLDALTALDADELSVELIDNFTPSEYAVTDREIEISQQTITPTN